MLDQGCIQGFLSTLLPRFFNVQESKVEFLLALTETYTVKKKFIHCTTIPAKRVVGFVAHSQCMDNCRSPTLFPLQTVHQVHHAPGAGILQTSNLAVERLGNISGCFLGSGQLDILVCINLPGNNAFRCTLQFFSQQSFGILEKTPVNTRLHVPDNNGAV